MMASTRILVACAIAAFSLPLHARITGRVVDENGAAIAGARVRAFARESFEQWYARALSSAPQAVAFATTATDRDGTYSFESKGDAGVDVVAQAPGKRAGYRIALDGMEARTLILQNGRPRRVHITADGKPVAGALIVDRFFVAETDASGFADTEEPDGGIYESPLVIHRDFAIGRADPPRRDSDAVLEIVLVPGTTVRGRVLDGDGEVPVTNAIIAIDNLPLARSTVDGSFTIEHAPPNWRALTARDEERVGIHPSSSDPFVIRLRPGGRAEGVVRNALDGSPISGAAVWITQRGDRTPFRLTLVDRNGAFVLRGVPAGEYVIAAGHFAYAGSVRRLTITEGAAAGEDIAMMPFGTITGVVVDKAGNPVGGALVTRSNGGQPNVTGANGRFHLRIPPSNSAVFIEARKNGYTCRSAGSFAIRGGETLKDVALVMAKE